MWSEFGNSGKVHIAQIGWSMHFFFSFFISAWAEQPSSPSALLDLWQITNSIQRLRRNYLSLWILSINHRLDCNPSSSLQWIHKKRLWNFNCLICKYFDFCLRLMFVIPSSVEFHVRRRDASYCFYLAIRVYLHSVFISLEFVFFIGWDLHRAGALKLCIHSSCHTFVESERRETFGNEFRETKIKILHFKMPLMSASENNDSRISRISR